jgi:hypothetical protein
MGYALSANNPILGEIAIIFMADASLVILNIFNKISATEVVVVKKLINLFKKLNQKHLVRTRY